MNPTNNNKIQLFKQQNQLNKQLKTKKDMIAQVKRSYNKNKKIAQEQIDLIKQLTEAQKNYYVIISEPPPISDSKNSQYHQYRHLIDDLDKSYKEIENDDSELAFPFDEDISPNIDQYSDLYNQIDDWLQTKENSIEEGDEQQKKIKREIEKLRESNLQLKNHIEEEPDVSEQIREISSIIKEKEVLLSSKNDIISLYQQKQKELEFLISSIAESQQKNAQESNEHRESDEENDIRIDKEVNVHALNKLQSKALEKWEELRQIQTDYHFQVEKMKSVLRNMKKLLG